MSLLIIQPNLTSEEAQKWLVLLFIQILKCIEPNEVTEANLIYDAKHLSYEETDAIFEKAMKGLLE